MKPLSPQDAECIAIASEHGKMPPNIAAMFLRRMKGQKAKLVFQALISDESTWGKFPSDIVKEARAQLLRVNRHRRLVAELLSSPCSQCGRSPDVR